jgi:hypothetical protein
LVFSNSVGSISLLFCRSKCSCGIVHLIMISKNSFYLTLISCQKHYNMVNAILSIPTQRHCSDRQNHSNKMDKSISLPAHNILASH